MKRRKELLAKIIVFFLMILFNMEALSVHAQVIREMDGFSISRPGLVPKGTENPSTGETTDPLINEDNRFSMPPAYKELLSEIYQGVFEKNFSLCGAQINYSEKDIQNSMMSDSAKRFFLVKLQDSGQGGSDLTKTLYALRDLDEDGVPELLLTAADHNVDCIYTQKEDEAIPAAEFVYRNEANIYGRKILSEGSSGGAEYGVSLLNLDPKTQSVQWLESMTIRYGVENAYILQPSQEVVSEARYNQQLADWKEGTEPAWKELYNWVCLSENVLSGTVYTNDMNEDVVVPFDLFETPTNEYHPELAEFSILLAQSSYDDKHAHDDPETYGIAYTFQSLGFKDENIALYGYFENAPFSKDVKGILRDDTFGFAIGHREINNKILLIIAIRGSHSDTDWWKDIAGALASNTLMNLNVHCGFYQFYQDLQRGLNSYFKEHPELQTAMQNDRMKILVAGHSLGGACANVLGAAIGSPGVCPWMDPYWNAHDNTYVYTFASPRTFNTFRGRKGTAGLCDNIFNVAINNDPVPMVPIDTGMKEDGTSIFSDIWYRFGWKVVYDSNLLPLPINPFSHDGYQYLEVIRKFIPKQEIGEWSVIQGMMCSH